MLAVVDVLVSKLKRLSASDLSDIEAMVERDLVSHGELVGRFRSAYDEFTYDARAAELPRYVDNLHRVERDVFAVRETDFDLDALR